MAVHSSSSLLLQPDAESEQQWFQLCFGKKQQTTTAQW
jgi:hypothetical protein